MTITPIIAPQSLHCFRCLRIGIPAETIAKGDSCMEIATPRKIEFACMDCYDRMFAEINEEK